MATPRKWKNEAERKRAYREKKRREEAKAAAPAAAPVAPATSSDDGPVSAVMAAVLTNPSLAVLESIRDNPRALDSDRIRASTEIQKIKTLEAERRQGGTELADLRAIIEALPVGERLPYLKGEVDAHRAAGAYTNEHKEDA